MRPRLEPGKHGEISSRKIAPGKHKARVKYRDERGTLREITAQGKTKAESINRLQDRLKNLTLGNAHIADMPLREFAWQWFETYRAGVSESTARTTEIILRTQLNPVGDILLRQITVQWCENRIREAGVKREITNRFGGVITAGGISTQRRLRTVLMMILDEAVRLDGMPLNPARATRPIPKTPPAPVALNREELARLRRNVRSYYEGVPERAKAASFMPDLIDFLVGTGCRIGEAMGLKWDAVDLEAGTVIIRSQVVQSETGASLWAPHTKTRQERLLYMPSWLVEVLAGRERRGELVFTSSTGSLLRYARTSENFRRARGDEFDGVTLKAIRSSVATLVERELGFRAAGLQLGHEGFENLRSYVARRGSVDAAGALEDL